MCIVICVFVGLSTLGVGSYSRWSTNQIEPVRHVTNIVIESVYIFDITAEVNDELEHL